MIMEIQTVLLLTGITVLILGFIFKPLLSKNHPSSPNNSEYSQWVAERERIINILKELDFDQTLGKIPDDDYAAQRAELVARGGMIMEKLDRMGKSEKQPKERSEKDQQLSDKDIERMLEKRKALKSGSGEGHCPQCGKPVLRSDLFCPSCGKKLVA